ncbi:MULTISPECIES: response regulator transcription factor [Agrobacterium]|uniref:response regulator transcription factor n=1 Tax=Agrobacterium TaxID=357 RepID=UPI002301A7D1|nr:MULTISPECIES: response regulator transcription factor [Agrobacterium]MDA5639245.1 response regulator transcription factor [Agrobacterium sp. ST15.13.013]MDA6999280.1 response regulator transcription factor [Agrobacterium salinitolerans]
MLLRYSIIIHTTDPELYLILRYILEQAGHDVDLLPSLDTFLPDNSKVEPQRRTVLICLATDDLLRSAVLMKKKQPDIRLVGFPLDNKMLDGVQSSVFDYLVRRPFDPGSLLEFLKYGLPSNTTAPTDLNVFLDDVEINVASVRVRRGETHISLSPLHFRILLYLARNTDRVVSRDELIRNCWPEDADVEPRTVDIHIGKIRRSLNRHGRDVIRTVRSAGYSATKL